MFKCVVSSIPRCVLGNASMKKATKILKQMRVVVMFLGRSAEGSLAETCDKKSGAVVAVSRWQDPWHFPFVGSSELKALPTRQVQ